MSRGNNLAKEEMKKGRRFIGSDDSDEDFVVDDEEEEEEEEDDDDEDEYEDDDSEDDEDDVSDDNSEEENCESSGSEASYNSDVNRRKKRKPLRRGIRKKRTRGGILSYEEEDEEDEEFEPGSEYSSGEEENSVVFKRCLLKKRITRVTRKKPKRKSVSKRRKKVGKRAVVKNNKRKRCAWRITSGDDDFVVDDEKESRKKAKLKHRNRKKRSGQTGKPEDLSDLDSLSDPDFVISDEEIGMLEQVPGDRNLETSVGSSFRYKACKDTGESGEGVQKRRILRLTYKEDEIGCKGKEKLTGLCKQVCGICLSEERNGTIRGKLNCCDHFFCFVCIMEWSKVESRCPMCKQRFETIDKLSNSGICLRNVSVKVPCRNQVYQPSEEELRSYLDPYASIVCMECHQGGDDSLMLLCDVCDSSAHTFCVGLGMEVPEGNWYCEGCKASEGGSSDLPELQNTVPVQFAGSNLCLESSAGCDGSNRHTSFDLNSEYVETSRQTSCQGNDTSSRFPICGEPGPGMTSPGSGAGASTVMGRRRLRRQIHTILTSNRMNQAPDLIALNNSFVYASVESDAIKSEVEQDAGEKEHFGRSEHERVHVSLDGNARCQSYCLADGFGESSSQHLQHLDCFPGANLSCLRRHAAQIPIGSTTINNVSDNTHGDQLKEVLSSQVICAKGIQDLVEPLSTGPICDRNSSQVHDAKQQVCSFVKRHLKSFFTDGYIDRCEFKDIAKQSTYTILAAYGIRCSDKKATFIRPPNYCHIGDGFRLGSLINVCCAKCFNKFVDEVVQLTAGEFVKAKKD